MKIFVFGDSFSQPYGNPNFKRLHWSNHLGIALDCEIKMFAKCGSTNENILHALIREYDNISNDDIVILNLSGQGRINLGPDSHMVWYRDRMVGVDINTHRFRDIKYDIVKEWYNTYHLPTIVKDDPNINSIIHLCNRLGKRVKDVILWNLSQLGFDDLDVNENDNVKTSPNIPHSDLWTKSSEGGKRGWASILKEKDLTISENDGHPNAYGYAYIAEEFLERIDDTKSLDRSWADEPTLI